MWLELSTNLSEQPLKPEREDEFCSGFANQADVDEPRVV